jgi:hypothetical protein
MTKRILVPRCSTVEVVIAIAIVIVAMVATVPLTNCTPNEVSFQFEGKYIFQEIQYYLWSSKIQIKPVNFAL